MKIPPSLIGLLGKVMSDEYTHAQIDSLFLSASFPDEVPGGSKITKVQQWLRLGNKSLSNPMEHLALAIAEYMDQPDPEEYELENDDFHRKRFETYQANKKSIEKALAVEGLIYYRGGRITRGGVSGSSISLEQKLISRPVITIQEEFDRALENVDSQPRHAIDAACAILESVCKYYLTRCDEPLPSDKSLKPLWNATAKHLGLNPASIEDDDLKRILSGMYSIADGVASLRTHAGGAHGRLEPNPGEKRYKVLPRHARLAVHSAHTLALFILETWESKKS